MKHHGQNRALAVVSDILSRTGSGDPLPSVRELARSAGVSPVTMLKTLRSLAANGTLVSRGRQGYHVAAPQSPFPVQTDIRDTPPRSRRGAATIMELIQKDIYSGEWQTGSPLPPKGYLVQRYATSYRTVTAALEFLTDKKMLERCGKGYALPRIATGSSSGTILMVGRGHDDGRFVLAQRSTQRNLLLIEQECIRRALQVVTAAGYFLEQDLHWQPTLESFTTGRARSSIMGAVVLTHGFGIEQRQSIIRTLSKGGFPIAVFDEGAGLTLEHVADCTTDVRVFVLSPGKTPGRIVGQYLLGMGHRSVAYFSLYPELRWPQQRLEGLREAYTAADLPDSVQSFAPSEKPGQTNVPGIRQWIRSAISAAEYSPLPELPNSQQLLRKALSSLGSNRIRAAMQDFFDQELLGSLVDRALACPDITAWVAENDGRAVQILQVLKSRGLSVPRDISLISFDDLEEAYFQRLTSYSFNIAALARLAVEFLVRPHPHRDRSPKKIVQVNGAIVVRASVASRGTAVSPLR